MDETTPVSPRPAAAIVLIQPRAGGGIEVFMVRRHVRNEFAPDVYVFPGGSVKEEDRQTERMANLCAAPSAGPTTLGSGFRVAALRECFEEAGVLLAHTGDHLLAIGREAAERYAEYRAGLQGKTMRLATIAQAEGLVLATDILLHWAHWITPEAYRIRFDTHFFLAAMPAEQQAIHDEFETTDDVWISPEDALLRFEAGDFPLVFATIHQLRALSGMRGITEARERFASTTPRTIMPRIVRRDGVDVVLLPEEA